MTSYLVESYTPAATLVTPLEARMRQAAAGTAVRYDRSIFVPDDEVCFHLLEAPCASAVDAVMRSAGIGAQRVMEVAR